MSNSPDTPNPNRREFCKKASAVVLGGLSAGVPVAAGFRVLLDPLSRASSDSGMVRVATLDALPADGVPRQFTIHSDRSDAWNHYTNVPIGAVYLRRLGDDQVEALQATCPHAGCFVDYVPGRNGFFCPCHNSSFALDGRLADAKSPSPRAMDTLAVEIRNEREVWVKFQNFHAGRAEKVPVA